ncbi:MAG: flagellar brake protein [Gammaproteobacteria bacterium]
MDPDTVQPDAVDTLPAAFRIEGTLAVRAILRDLKERHVSVSLHPERNLVAFLVSRIAEVDEEEVEFDLSGQDALLDMLTDVEAVIGVAFPGRVKTQFRLSNFQLLTVDPPGYPALRAALPVELYRIQRRDAFRVTPPQGDQAECVRSLSPEGEARYVLADLSAGGAAVLLPPKTPVPAPGERWARSRIETAGDLVIPCELVVRHVAEEPVGSGAHRVGMAFHATPSEVQRQIQLYVLDIDRRSRRGA